MTDTAAPEYVPARREGFDRRTLLRVGAWSAPVVLLATAAPAAVASGEACEVGSIATVTRTTWAVTAGMLSDWDRGNTGWTPIDGSVDLDAANRPAQTAWVGEAGTEGFVSSGDGGTTVTTVVVEYTFEAIEGATYSLSTRIVSQPAYGSDNTVHAQWLDIDAIQGSASEPIAREVVGQIGAPSTGYSLDLQYGNTATRTATITAGVSGTVIIRYTFNLAAMANPKPTGASQGQVNSDFWVTAPTAAIVSCPA